MLALLDDESLKHPALECVFTVQEEVGLNGAMGLDKSILKAKKMIDLIEGKKIITVSCSGGRRAVVEKELSYLKMNHLVINFMWVAYKVDIQEALFI